MGQHFKQKEQVMSRQSISPSRRSGSGGAVVIVLVTALFMVLVLCVLGLFLLPPPAASAAEIRQADRPQLTVLTTATQLEEDLAIAVHYRVSLSKSADEQPSNYEQKFEGGYCQLDIQDAAKNQYWFVTCTSKDGAVIIPGWMSEGDFWFAALGVPPVDWAASPADLKGQNVLVHNGTFLYSALSNDRTRHVAGMVTGDVPCKVLDQSALGITSQYTDFMVDCGEFGKGLIERSDFVLGAPLGLIAHAQMSGAFTVNVRADPSTRAAVVSKMNDTTAIYEVIASEVADGRTWLRLVNAGVLKNWSYGWVAADFFSVTVPPAPPVSVPEVFTARLKAGVSAVNVRALYSTTYAVIGKITQRANSYTIRGRVTPPGDVEWLKIEWGSGFGWVRSDFFDIQKQ